MPKPLGAGVLNRACKKCGDKFHWCASCGWNGADDDAREHGYCSAYCAVVGQAERIEALEAERQWISVEDRLPKPTIQVMGDEIATVLVATAQGAVFEAQYSNTRKQWDYMQVVGAPTPSHWMPIPEPPEVKP